MERNRDLSRFHHSAWTTREGAPADIWALAQAPDGLLWLGTGGGLYRFDGIRFERQQLPGGGQLLANNITALSIVSADEAWIGYYAGGASMLARDAVVHYGAGEGMPEGVVFRFAQDGDGVLWAATAGGLARFEGGRWHIAGSEWNYPWRYADWALRDSRGTLWVSNGDTVVFLRRGATAFERTGVRTAMHAVLSEAPDGAIWISDSLHGTRPLPIVSQQSGDARVLANGLETLQSKRMEFHSDGSLWGTDAARGGAYRVAFPTITGEVPHAASTPGVVEAFGKRQGLSADMAVPVLEDSEGNVWIGTNLGLNRFRHNNVVALAEGSEAAHLGFGLAAGTGDTVMLASGGSLFAADGRSTRTVMQGLPRVVAALRGVDGTLWLVSPEAFWKTKEGKREQVPLPGNSGGRDIRALLADRSGALWMSLSRMGMYRFHDGEWMREEALSGELPDVLAAGPQDALWLGYPQNRVAVYRAGSVRSYSTADGLQVGNVTAISAGRRHVLAAGENGLALLSGDRFLMLGGGHADQLTGITGMAETADGDVWLNGGKGVVRIPAAELERALEDPRHAPHHALFDGQDGLPGVAVQSGPVSTMVAAGNGLLWVATNQGAAWVDPARLRSNPLPPTVSVRSLTAAGVLHEPVRTLRLPERTTGVEIEYTATSLTHPERIRFRYRLEGADTEWQDAGARRQAFYTNLAPGRYRFRVIAANNDGVWNESGASLEFSIAPTFFQSGWFLVVCIAAVLGALWLMYLLRLRQLGLHIRTRLHERHMERERIARELHDTLLQSIQGLILRFQAVAETIPPREPARLAMESALERADEVLMEGRDRVLDLRAASQYSGDLSEVFTRVAEELAQDHQAGFRLVSEGVQQELDPIVRDEIFRIGREALLNAYHHADAANIEVEIIYAREELRLRFLDDGRGIDARVLERGGRPGHWGLSGMRERAERIGARLRVWSRAGAGTEIELSMPAAAAYRPCLKASRWSWLSRLRGAGR